MQAEVVAKRVEGIALVAHRAADADHVHAGVARQRQQRQVGLAAEKGSATMSAFVQQAPRQKTGTSLTTRPNPLPSRGAIHRDAAEADLAEIEIQRRRPKTEDRIERGARHAYAATSGRHRGSRRGPRSRPVPSSTRTKSIVPQRAVTQPLRRLARGGSRDRATRRRHDRTSRRCCRSTTRWLGPRDEGDTAPRADGMDRRSPPGDMAQQQRADEAQASAAARGGGASARGPFCRRDAHRASGRRYAASCAPDERDADLVREEHVVGRDRTRAAVEIDLRDRRKAVEAEDGLAIVR